jgi:hypothetical protein
MTPRLFVFALAVAVCTPTLLCAQSDPVGDQLKKLEQQLGHKRAHKRLEAIERLGHMGKRARRLLPKVVAILNQDDDPNARILAARSSAKIGATNPRVYKALSAVLDTKTNHYQLRTEATRALGHVAKASPTLRPRILKQLSAEMRAEGNNNVLVVALANALGELGEEAFASGPSLERTLQTNKIAEVRVACFIAMARVSRRPKNLEVKTVVAALKKETKVARRARVYGHLRILGPEAKDAVEALLHVAKGKASPLYERVAALDALAAIDPTQEAIVDEFVAAASSGNYVLKPAGRRCLDTISRSQAGAAVPALIKHANASDDDVRITVVETLYRIAPTKASVKSLLEGLIVKANAKDSQLFLHAVMDGLRAARSQTSGDALVKLLDRGADVHKGRDDVSQAYLIAHALVVLSELGVPAKHSERILDELRRAHPYTLPAACRAVGALGPKGAPGVAHLLKVIDKRPWTPMLPFLADAFPTVEAIRALGRIGPAAKSAIPALTKLSGLRDGARSVVGRLEVQAARKALAAIRG